MKSSRLAESDRNPMRTAATYEDSIKAMYPTADFQNQGVNVLQNIPAVKDVMRQKDENKRIFDLRAQVRRTPIETHKPPRTSGSVASYGSKEKKKDGKGRDQLAKTVDRLKFEKLQLEKKVNDLMQAIHLAEVLSERALLRSHEKDQVILSLRKESVLANDVKLSEINRRCRLEAELEATRVYVEHTQLKKAEKMRNKEVQTDTSIPTNLNFDAIKPTSPFKKVSSSSSSSNMGQSKSYSSFKALESATSLWKTKQLEQEFQKQTKIMKQRFMTAATKSTDLDRESNQEELLKISSARKYRRYSYPAEELIASQPSISNPSQKKSMLTNSNMLKESGNIAEKLIPSPPMSPPKPVQYIKSSPTYFQHSTTAGQHFTSAAVQRYAKLQA